MNKELLDKYLNNTCSQKEFDEVEQWFNSESVKKEGKKWGFDDWNSFAPESKKDKLKYSVLLDKIHHQINLKAQNTTRTNKVKVIGSWFSRAAAVLFIPLLLAMLYILSNKNVQTEIFADAAIDTLEIIAPVGSRAIVELSDGTKVNLNYGSRIKYPRIFVGKEREIYLEGEGYFDVAPNPKKPFVVKTGKINVKALGTEFNVQAYADNNLISTTLVEGKVVVEKLLTNEKIQQLGIMVPGQHVVYDLKTDKAHSVKGAIDRYIAWKDGKLVFDNTPISEVAQTLSRMFNVDIEVDDAVKEYTYTVTFINDPLFLILDLMKETTPVTYKTLPRKRKSDGTYTKQKIKISLKK